MTAPGPDPWASSPNVPRTQPRPRRRSRVVAGVIAALLFGCFVGACTVTVGARVLDGVDVAWPTMPDVGIPGLPTTIPGLGEEDPKTALKRDVQVVVLALDLWALDGVGYPRRRDQNRFTRESGAAVAAGTRVDVWLTRERSTYCVTGVNDTGMRVTWESTDGKGLVPGGKPCPERLYPVRSVSITG